MRTTVDSHFYGLLSRHDSINSLDKVEDRILMNRYVAETLLAIIETSEDTNAYKSGVLAFIQKLKNSSTTLWSQLCIYLTFLVAIAKQEVADDEEVIAAIDEAIRGMPNLSSNFMMELALFKGKKLLKLFEAPEELPEDKDDLSAAQK